METTVDSGMDERRLVAARRHWRIEYALMLMDARSLRLVRLIAEQQLHPARAAFGECGNVAHFSQEAMAARDNARSRKSVAAYVDRLGMRLALGKATKSEQLAAKQIRDGAELVLNRPVREYLACRRRAK